MQIWTDFELRFSLTCAYTFWPGATKTLQLPTSLHNFICKWSFTGYVWLSTSTSFKFKILKNWLTSKHSPNCVSRLPTFCRRRLPRARNDSTDLQNFELARWRLRCHLADATLPFVRNTIERVSPSECFGVNLRDLKMKMLQILRF